MTTRANAVQALSWPMVDYEDALQAVAAQACSAHWIITRNERDFAASPVPSLTPEAFLSRYPLS